MPHAPINEILLRPPFLAALLFAVLFAGGAYAARLLTVSGAISTLIVGVIVFGVGGGGFAIPLLTFFLTSSLLSKIAKARKHLANRGDAKGNVRDAGQVWANGGVAALMALLFGLYSAQWPLTETRYVMMLFLAALSAVNADTWATEIGKLSHSAPRLLTNWKPVAPGTSGAISGMGTFGAFLGALIIPLSALFLWSNLTFTEIFAVTYAGFLGSLIDSVLGATLQAQYKDQTTGETTERTVGEDGRSALLLRGLPWFNNDVVNFCASIGGAVCAYILLRYGAYRFY